MRPDNLVIIKILGYGDFRQNFRRVHPFPLDPRKGKRGVFSSFNYIIPFINLKRIGLKILLGRRETRGIQHGRGKLNAERFGDLRIPLPTVLAIFLHHFVTKILFKLFRLPFVSSSFRPGVTSFGKMSVKTRPLTTVSEVCLQRFRTYRPPPE